MLATRTVNVTHSDFGVSVNLRATEDVKMRLRNMINGKASSGTNVQLDPTESTSLWLAARNVQQAFPLITSGGFQYHHFGPRAYS